MTVVAVGKSSFLAGALRATQPPNWIFLSHRDALASTGWIDNASCIVNFSYSPALRSGEYDAAEDIDLKLASLVSNRPVHYIMLSSRAAYGPATGDGRLREGQEENPSTAYGRNKLATERALREIIGGRLTVLRAANIFGHEKGRKTFFGLSLSGLAERGVISFDMNPAQRRDFLSAWRFADALKKIAAKPVAGLFNLGAGFGTPCEKIAQWLIEGYGSGIIEVKDSGKTDSFWLDMNHTHATFGIPDVTTDDLRQDCISCGAKLKNKLGTP